MLKINKIDKKIIEKEIDDIISKIDITPLMYKNAVEKYSNLKGFFLESGEDIIFYPQGSFMLGTTVRPYSQQLEKNYDLDAICLFNYANAEIEKPEKVRIKLENMLNQSKMYKDKIKYYDRCVTVEYANYGNVGFNIDVVPSINADARKLLEMKIKGCLPQYLKTAINITEKKKDGKFCYVSSNPEAYVDWFNEINMPYVKNNADNVKKYFFNEYADLYASEKDVPEYFNKSSLQKAIQLLKRARDIHYSKLGKDKENLKPISAIISTLVLDMARIDLIPYNASTLDVIKIVIEELKKYSEYQTLSDIEFKNKHLEKTTITRKNGEWEMLNPVNPCDNLVDSWNKNKDSAKLFFDWINNLEKDLITIFENEDIDYRRVIGNVLGNKIVEEYYFLPKLEEINEGPKPWKN